MKTINLLKHKEGLKIIGKVSNDTLEKLSLSKKLDCNIVLFTTHSDYEIPLNHTFTLIKSNSGASAIFSGLLVGITQQFNKSLDCIPQGWKTIIYLKIEHQIPQILADLPEFDGWDTFEAKCILLPTE
ncbi:MAG: hypothetical protein AB8G22_15400 [Saprospiraceae bacterium]